MKKLSILLTLVLVLQGLFLATALGEDETHVSGDFEYVLLDDGTAEITAYTGSSAKLDIPAQLDGHAVSSIGSAAFFYCTSLEEVTIPDGVTSICNGAFSWCLYLTRASIPEGVVSIGERAFNECLELREISIPDSVVSIGDTAFSLCDSLTKIVIPDSVVSLGINPFYNCISLTEIIVSPEHPALTTLDGVLFDKTGTELICYPCGLPARSYAVPQGTISIGNSAFTGCESLTEVSIPEGVASIGNLVFASCDSLIRINIPDSAVSIGNNPFNYCDQLTEIQVSPNHPTLETIDGALFDKSEKRLIFYPRAFTAESYAVPQGTLAIDDTAFSGCTSLREIVLPDGLISIGEYAFTSCTSLCSINIPDSVASISKGAFHNCASLTDLAIPDSVTFIDDGAFTKCNALTLTVSPGSYAESYAKESGIPYVSPGENG